MGALANFFTEQATLRAMQLANQATQALLDEARLSPKPGLVDSRSSGAHHDLTLALMEKSAQCLTGSFYAMALCSYRQSINSTLRKEIGHIGREGESRMMATTGGINTHRGAIWAMGLLVTTLSAIDHIASAEEVANLAGKLASLPDAFAPQSFSKGLYASRRYKVPGAREEAQQGFPHIIKYALPTLRASRQAGSTEQHAQVDALLSIMSSLTDTCLLSRGGMAGLTLVQQGASAILSAGGIATEAGQLLFQQLEQRMLADNLSPGGAADLLAATLLLDRTTVIQ